MLSTLASTPTASASYRRSLGPSECSSAGIITAGVPLTNPERRRPRLHLGIGHQTSIPRASHSSSLELFRLGDQTRPHAGIPGRGDIMKGINDDSESTQTGRHRRRGGSRGGAGAWPLCSEGGANSNNAQGGGGGGGAGDNSGYTIAMITHETPGDTFWDKIKAGAQQAAKNYGIDLKYSNDPEPAKQATLIQNAVDSKVDGIATTLATPDALAGAVEDGERRQDPGRGVQLRDRPVPGRRRADVLRLRREPGRRDGRCSGSPRTAASTRSA